LKECDYCRKDDWQKAENDAGIESGLLPGLSDHLIHSICAQDLPESVGRIGVLLDLLKERINAFRAGDGLLFSKHGLQESADQARHLV
jgi:hypothetical protein